MILRRFTDFILQNRLQAMGAAFLLSFIPLVGGSLSILIAALVTLRQGAFLGTLVLCAAMAPCLLSYIYIALSASEQTHVILMATTIVIIVNMLTWLYALILRRYNNWSLVIEAAALSGVIAIFGISLVYPDIQNGWLNEVTRYLNKIMGHATSEGGAISEDMQANIATSIQEVKQYAVGIMVVSLVFNAVVQLIVARWWQATLFNPGGLRKELYQIRLSFLSAIVFVIVAGLAYLGQTGSVNALPVVAAAFCAAGLSLIHYLLKSNKAGWFWLMLVYLGILFMSWIGVALVAIAGLLDCFLDIRKRLGII